MEGGGGLRDTCLQVHVGEEEGDEGGLGKNEIQV